MNIKPCRKHNFKIKMQTGTQDEDLSKENSIIEEILIYYFHIVVSKVRFNRLSM